MRCRFAAYGLPNVYQSATVWEQYLVSVYWCARRRLRPFAHGSPAQGRGGLRPGYAARRCVSTLTTNGQVGAATPQNLGEMAFTAVLMVLTVTIFNYVLGEITNVIMAQDAALVATRAQARTHRQPKP